MTIVSDDDPDATPEGSLRAARQVQPGCLTYHGPLFVRQLSPRISEVDAVLRFELRHFAALAEILAHTDERVRLLIRLDREPEPAVRVHTDLVYHPYEEYVRCIAAFAPFLTDADFVLCLRHEDDDGGWTYLVDRYRIVDGDLSRQRSRTPDEDLDGYFAALR